MSLLSHLFFVIYTSGFSVLYGCMSCIVCLFVCLVFFFFFFVENTKYFNTHTGRGEKILKETDSGIYPKNRNSWIHSTLVLFIYFILKQMLFLVLGLLQSVNNFRPSGQE